MGRWFCKWLFLTQHFGDETEIFAGIPCPGLRERPKVVLGDERKQLE